MKLSQRCDELKALELEGHLSLWIVHRHLKSRRAVYEVFRVDVESSLEEKLRGLVKDAVQAIGSLHRYNYETPPEDDRVFVLDADEGGFLPLRELLEQGSQAPLIQSDEDLVNSFAYIIKISISGGDALYAFRKVSDLWTTKKVGGFHSWNMFFQGGMLIDLDTKPVFRIDREIDFIAFQGDLVIFDRQAFESGLNFRESLERGRDVLVEELEERAMFDDPSVFVKVIEDRLPLLRKTASIREYGYYKDDQYVESMVQQAAVHGWPVQVKDEKIVVREEIVPLLLKLLNNDRLQSPINREIFDVWGKERVPGTTAVVAATGGPRLTVQRKSPQKAPPRITNRRKRPRAS
jgi:Kiwa KwaB-like protein